MVASAVKQESYQPFTSPIAKHAKCFAGKTVLIHPDAQKSVSSLPADATRQLNNQMSCIATTNINSFGSHKVYIETQSGLIEFTISRKANRTETLIEAVSYLKGLQKPWQGQLVKPSKHAYKSKNGYTSDSYYSVPIFSYPNESLNAFLLRVSPMILKLTWMEYSAGGQKVRAGSEHASAIFVSESSSVKQYALVIETHLLPHLSASTRKPPFGFRTKRNSFKGKMQRETIHTHGRLPWDRYVKEDTESFIKIFSQDKEQEEILMSGYYDVFESRSMGRRMIVRSDGDDFSDGDFKSPGWLVTDDRCLKFQRGSDNVIPKGCF